MRVFSTLRNATAEALYTIVNEHPEAFASLRGVDDNGNEVKIEKSESAGSAIRDITARPNFVQVAMSTSTTAKSQSSSEGSQHANIPSSTTIAGGNDASVFVVKEEDPEIPWPQRIALLEPDVNSRFGTHLGGIPEPTYVFWGKYKISSFGLKMEARRADGAAVKVSVHLKNLRKPTYG
ncbi:hypothetical protein NUW58_g10343 [Xylaria curta]|uniref:Uncharacterized protein n=1 Tax=Xylaria curta TaxID=42375 RepID=A0ACC1MMM9_9PEZI|nr:hypothetical protein NUW58_g10343 [Xylaria curta]